MLFDHTDTRRPVSPSSTCGKPDGITHRTYLILAVTEDHSVTALYHKVLSQRCFYIIPSSRVVRFPTVRGSNAWPCETPPHATIRRNGTQAIRITQSGAAALLCSIHSCSLFCYVVEVASGTRATECLQGCLLTSAHMHSHIMLAPAECTRVFVTALGKSVEVFIKSADEPQRGKEGLQPQFGWHLQNSTKTVDYDEITLSLWCMKNPRSSVTALSSIFSPYIGPQSQNATQGEVAFRGFVCKRHVIQQVLPRLPPSSQTSR